MILARIDPIRIVLLGVFAALAVASLLGESPTWDEPVHLAAGFRFLKTGDPSWVVEDHPPGIRALAAIPLVLAGRPLEPLTREDPRTWVQRLNSCNPFLAADGAANLRLFPWAKLVIVLLAAGLGWIVYDESRRLYGVAGARLTLALYALDPNMIAHARLVTTDMGATLGFWLGIVALFRWSRRPIARRAMLVGVALGFGLLAKHSLLLMLPIAPILVLILLAGRRDAPGPARVAGGAVLALATAFVLVWGVHSFSVGRVEEARTSDAEVAAPPEAMGAWLDSWTVPAPDYVRGVRRQIRHAYEQGHPSYLHGEFGRSGWRTYFPIAFAIKTPIPTLLLGLAALLSFARRRPGREEIALLAFVLFVFGSAVRGNLNIGYRHILPILPPLFVLAGRLLAPRAATPGAHDGLRRAVPAPFAAALGALLVWLAAGTARIHPHPLAYFNELIGGPRHGWKWMVDASLDWGQDLPGLARWLREHDVDLVNLSYFGTIDPGLYGIRWLPISIPTPKSRPIPSPGEIPEGIYAISATNLVDVGGQGRGPLVAFQSLEPAAVIGHSIFVYDVGPRAPAARADSAAAN